MAAQIASIPVELRVSICARLPGHDFVEVGAGHIDLTLPIAPTGAESTADDAAAAIRVVGFSDSMHGLVQSIAETVEGIRN